MPRFCLACAGLFFVLTLGLRVCGYLEGQAFEKGWSPLPLGLLAFGCLVVGGIATLWLLLATVAWKEKWKEKWPRRLLVILALPLAWFAAGAVPIPSFTDGMRDALRENVAPERLRHFAEAMRRVPLPPERPEPIELPARPDSRLEAMRRDFPDLYRLSSLPPRIGVDPQGVQIFWGSALVKHWGIRIGSRPFADAPAGYAAGTSSREAYPGIWVYHDRY